MISHLCVVSWCTIFVSKKHFDGWWYYLNLPKPLTVSRHHRNLWTKLNHSLYLKTYFLSLPYIFLACPRAHWVPEEGREFSASDFQSYPLAANMTFSFVARQRLPPIYSYPDCTKAVNTTHLGKDNCTHLLKEVSNLNASMLSLHPPTLP